MARLPRLQIAGVTQHVVQRGNNKQACFFVEKDYALYLSKLKEYGEKYKVLIHSYTLMTNHVHLLLTPQEDKGVSQLMQSLGRYYVGYINYSQERTGTLWEGRFKSSVIDSERYLLTVSRYIELNPVRANMVDCPAEYPWSSYHRNANGKPISLITPHHCYQLLGQSDFERQQAYKMLFNDAIISERSLAEIREALNRTRVLGGGRFKLALEKQSGRRVTPGTRGGDRKSEAYRDGLDNQ